ncbi:oligoendopeptidase F [Kordiimonas sediminis]|uniref:Oligopeptidase F n=1 Tax=Kordiimonas sediminis TaxID=1735581 RepID=A0A919ATJ6_9PROT|nr:oligoendopeptidase F [Kordiimonas sediminis]GHF25603.1 oligoendopeptidase F [Kordiimonas sediminis]
MFASKKRILKGMMAGTALFAGLVAPVVQAVDIEGQIRWDLTDLYASGDAWTAAHDKALEDIKGLAKYQGTLGDSAEQLQKASDEISAVYKEVIRLFVYATLKGDEDMRESADQERLSQARSLFAKMGQAVAFTNPEILTVGSEKIESFIKSNPGLNNHAFTLRDTLRREDHTLGLEAEGVLANAGETLAGPQSIYGLLANAAIEWPTVTLSTGEEVTLNQAGYSKYRAVQNRDDRKKVFDAFWSTWKKYEAPLGATLDNHVKGHIFTAKSRKYDSALASATSGSNIPTTVYKELVAAANENLPAMHAYLKLRQRMLGLDDLHYYDIYPESTALDREFSLDEAKELTLQSLQPFGEEYLAALREGFQQEWMHVYPQPGKRPGAYMFGSAYDVHPYLLLNYNKGFEDVSTFSHEWGHAVHTMLSKKNNSFENFSYSTYTAELASTTNEVLLQEYLLAKDLSDEERLYYIDRALEGIRGTFFRQTMFAEFELKIHELAESGQPLSGQKMTEIYLELLKKYHGHDQGVMTIDDAYGIEWAYIPHFYRNFYVYQYATSITGGTAFAERMREGDGDATTDYVNVLKAGGSEYPYYLLQKNGIDLATREPYDILIGRMNRLMEEASDILDRMGK